MIIAKSINEISDLLNCVIKDPAITAILQPLFIFYIAFAWLIKIQSQRKFIWSQKPPISKEEKHYHQSKDFLKLCLPGIVAFSCAIQIFFLTGEALRDLFLALNG